MPDDLLLNETEAEPPPCKLCGEPMKLMRTIVAEGTEQLDCNVHSANTLKSRSVKWRHPSCRPSSLPAATF